MTHAMNSINFNSHAHVERDARPLRGCAVPLHFNSHAHVERDITVIGKVKIADNFNSHAHVERDRQIPVDS